MIELFQSFISLAEENLPLRILFVGESWCDKTHSIVRDCSELNAFEFIISGSGTLDTEGQSLTPGPDDIFFLKEGTQHAYRADAVDPWHKIWVAFDGPFARHMIDCYLPRDTYLFRNCSIRNVFEEILQISRENLPYNKIVNRITVCLLRIFLYIHDRMQQDHEALPDIIRKKLDESVENTFCLEQLCKELSYSKNHVIHVFKDKFGITPYQYYLDRKIDTAKVYLVQTHMSISEIAKKLHYSDQQYFSSCFRAAVGVSPLAYRQQARQK